MGLRLVYGAIIWIPSLSVDADFPTAISCHIYHNWPPASHRSIPVQYVRVQARGLEGAYTSPVKLSDSLQLHEQ